MTKPSSKLEWASDGDALVADPGAPKRHAGFLVDEAPPAHWLNWLFKIVGQWVDYLDNLPSDEDFAGADFDWTGQHTILHAPQYSLPAIPRSKLPLSTAQPGLFNSSMYFYASGSQLNCHGSGGNALRVRFPIRFPQGTEITEVRCAAKPTAGSDLHLSLVRLDYDTTTPYGAGQRVVLATATLGAGSSVNVPLVATIAGSSEVISGTSEWFVEIDVGIDDATAAEIYWVDVRAVIKYLGVVV